MAVKSVERGTGMGTESTAALYARVSTQEQVEGYSLDAQVRDFRVLAESRGWEVYREYLEQGKSAHVDDVNKRPVFKEAIEDALAGKYDVLVVHKIDRFSRRRRITDEYFDKLSKAGVGFFSIKEQMDFSTPMGTFALGMLGGLAQLYSDNLGEETRKGLAERRAQGLYCGPLPFGAVKGEDGIPVPNPETLRGLVMAFEAAAKGKSDRQVAQLMNAHGYRTVGNRGGGPFTKDTVRGLLPNRFYIGELPEGKDSWIPGKHEPIIHPSLFQQVQAVRAKKRPRRSPIRRDTPTYSLSGLIRCVHCEGPMWIHRDNVGRPRIFCGSHKQGLKCQSKTTFLDVYEDQLLRYMKDFVIPGDYQERILSLYSSLSAKRQKAQSTKVRLIGRLDRLKKLYQWGDITEAEYRAESRDIKQDLEAIVEPEEDEAVLERLRVFLIDIGLAWERATDEQRNRLARHLFQTIWIRDRLVVKVRPLPELMAFFQISQESKQKSLSCGFKES